MVLVIRQPLQKLFEPSAFGALFEPSAFGARVQAEYGKQYGVSDQGGRSALPRRVLPKEGSCKGGLKRARCEQLQSLVPPAGLPVVVGQIVSAFVLEPAFSSGPGAVSSLIPNVWGVHSQKITWNLNIIHLKRKLIFQTYVWFYVSR